ncbi:MAG: hypothetical protein NWE87_04245 [Candidatus Bathyarchaeota archaeon]|nr:hypothetical protein [Candidatus Bathyarchaeota archaeon]
MNRLSNDVDGFSRGTEVYQSQLCPTCTASNYNRLKKRSTFKTRNEMRM